MTGFVLLVFQCCIDDNEEMMKLLRRNGVNYIVIYPEWFTNIIKRYSNALEKVYSVRLENNTICGGDEMFVYKIHWENEILKQSPLKSFGDKGSG